MDLLVMPGEGQGGCAVLVESTKTAEALEICHRFVLVLVKNESVGVISNDVMCEGSDGACCRRI